jgi:phosphohistidine phosphatase SixA
MYRADDISQDVIKDYEKFVIFHDHLKNYKIRGLFADIEELNKRVERFSIVPHDSSAKDLVRVIENSIEHDWIAVKQSCDDYFAALVPS